MGEVTTGTLWGEGWGDQRDSNPQQPESQSGTLPLSYGHQPTGRLDFQRRPVKFSVAAKEKHHWVCGGKAWPAIEHVGAVARLPKVYFPLAGQAGKALLGR